MKKYQEALDYLCGNYTYDGMSKWDNAVKTLQELIDREKEVEAIANDCNEMIEKAMPKKVIMIKPPKLEEPRGLKICSCPTCNRNIGFQNIDFDIKRANYCHECGQALDWEC